MHDHGSDTEGTPIGLNFALFLLLPCSNMYEPIAKSKSVLFASGFSSDALAFPCPPLNSHFITLFKERNLSKIIDRGYITFGRKAEQQYSREPRNWTYSFSQPLSIWRQGSSREVCEYAYFFLKFRKSKKSKRRSLVFTILMQIKLSEVKVNLSQT